MSEPIDSEPDLESLADEYLSPIEIWNFFNEFLKTNIDNFERADIKVTELKKASRPVVRTAISTYHRLNAISVFLEGGLNDAFDDLLDDLDMDASLDFELPSEIPKSRDHRVRALIENDEEYLKSYFQSIRSKMTEVEEKLIN